MRTMNNSQKTITSALEELGAELGVACLQPSGLRTE